MDPNKRVPAGCIHVHAILKFKQAGDFVKLREHFKAMVAETHKQDGMIRGEPFFDAGETPETATQVNSITQWKDMEALQKHRDGNHTKEFEALLKESGVAIEAKFYQPALDQ